MYKLIKDLYASIDGIKEKIAKIEMDILKLNFDIERLYRLLWGEEK